MSDQTVHQHLIWYSWWKWNLWILKVDWCDMSVTQRCVGPPVTWPLRSLSAPWNQDTKDMILLWTCECAERTWHRRLWAHKHKAVITTMSTRAVSSGWCLQMEFGGDHVHAACRLSSLLAQETNADAAHDLGREIWLLIPRMGGPLGHCQRLGRVVFSSQLVPFKKNFSVITILHWHRSESNSSRGFLRSLGCWWWTPHSDTQPLMFSTTPSFLSMWWMKCDSSVHTGGSRWDFF